MGATPAQLFLHLFHALSSLYIAVVALRFLLQLAQADFYNPISQFVVKATNPLVLPLRRIIPAVGRYDSASFVLAYVLKLIAILVILGILFQGIPQINPLLLLLWSFLGLLHLIIEVYIFAIIVSAIMSWFAQGNHNPFMMLLMQLTEPVLAPFRKLIPPLGGLDITPIFALLILQYLIKVGLLENFALASGLPVNIAGLVLGF